MPIAGVPVTRHDFGAPLPLSLGRHPHAIVPAFYTAAASARRGGTRRKRIGTLPQRCQTDRDGGGDDTRLMFAQRRTPPGRPPAPGPPILPRRPAPRRPCPPNPKQPAIVGSPNFLRVAARLAVRSFVRRSIERKKRDRSKC